MSKSNNCASLVNRFREDVRFGLQFLTKNMARKRDCELGKNVKLYYWRMSSDTENLGDYLSKVVVSHFMPQSVTKRPFQRTKTLLAIGSILGFRCQDVVVWGSGIISSHESKARYVRYSDLDIRAVRGPKTRQVMLDLGKKCPEVYGDPAILMPFIYNPEMREKKYRVSLIVHHEHGELTIPKSVDIHRIDISTTDYEKVIDEIVQSDLVISSSLHGIILAETYGVPAVLMLRRDAMVFKYEDWYYSTGRMNPTIVRSIEEALSAKPMELPDLSNMQKQLLDAFPSDLWVGKRNACKVVLEECSSYVVDKKG